MTEGFPWTVLGIAPTGDRRAIRSAYTAKLKAIDPEADPQAFIALREAYDSAQAEAAWRADESARWSPREAKPEAASGIHPLEEMPQPTDSADDHARALAAILYAERDKPWLDETELAAAKAHWAAISADQRMEQLDFYTNVERWAAGLLADTSPVSAALIPAVTRRFNWYAQEPGLSQRPEVAEVVRLYWLRGFTEAAQRPGHSHHPAWIELTTRAYPGSSRGRTDPHSVYELLTAVRQASPETEPRFDALRVALWRNNTADPATPDLEAERDGRRTQTFIRWYLVLGFIVTVIGMAMRAVSESSQ